MFALDIIKDEKIIVTNNDYVITNFRLIIKKERNENIIIFIDKITSIIIKRILFVLLAIVSSIILGVSSYAYFTRIRIFPDESVLIWISLLALIILIISLIGYRVVIINVGGDKVKIRLSTDKASELIREVSKVKMERC